MNVLFLLITALFALIFGYRFYAKLMALWVFRLNFGDYSTTIDTAGARQFTPCHPHVLFGHHVAAIGAAGTLTGTTIALVWGWIPAFLWLVVATVLAAGTYGLGSLWLSARYASHSVPEIAGRLLGPQARGLYFACTLALLLLLSAALLWLGARLLMSYPGSVLPFWLQIPIALVAGRALQKADDRSLWGVSLAAFVAGVIVIWLAGEIPVAFTGTLNLDVLGQSSLLLDAEVLWMVLLLVAALYAARLPVSKWMRPRGYLIALQAGAMLLVLLAGVVIAHPPITAPEFHTADGAPGPLPWLFITLTSGAIAGFHLLIANGITARQMADQTNLRRIGYGGALVDGLFALSAVIVVSAGFKDLAQWQAFYASWNDLSDLRQLPALYIGGAVTFAGSLGIGEGFARNFAAVTVLGLLVATLEAGLRIVKQSLVELGQCYGITALARAPAGTGLTVGAVLLAALWLAHSAGNGASAWWPLFGLGNQVFACLGLLLFVFALRQGRRPQALVLAPLLGLVAITLWAGWELLILGWRDGEGGVFVATLGLMTLEITILLKALIALKKAPQPAPNT